MAKAGIKPMDLIEGDGVPPRNAAVEASAVPASPTPEEIVETMLADTDAGGVEKLLSAGPKVVGSLVIDFLDDGMGHLVPKVSFNPLGRITPGIVDQYMPLVFREIQREQVRLRRGR